MFVIGFVFLIPACNQGDQQSYYPQQQQCSGNKVAFLAIRHAAEFIDVHNWILTALFAGLVTLFTWRLWQATNELRVSTDRLWKAGDEQLKFVKESSAEQAANMRASIEASRKSAEAAMKAAETAEKSLILEQRPWLIWNIKLPIKVFKAGRHVQATVETIFENIGKTPAMNVAYTARLYVVSGGEAIVNVGIGHLNEMSEEYIRGAPLVVTNILPSEKPLTTLRYGPDIAINDLQPSETGKFQLYLAIHAGYRLFDGGRIAEIGGLYILNAMVPPSAPSPPGGGQKLLEVVDFSMELFEGRSQLTVIPTELPSSRRIT